MTITRTDVHRPSSPQFDPQAYRFVGVFDNNANPLRRKTIVSDLIDRGYQYGAGGSSQCGHCGAHIRYTALLVRDDVQEFIFVGEDCLDNRFSGLSKHDFQRLRKEAALNRDRERKSAKVAAIYAANPGLEDALATDHYIVSNIKWRLERYGEISDKQIALVFKIQQQQAECAVVQAKREEEKQALIDKGVSVPEGRIKVTGKVLSIKEVDGQFGLQIKMLVQSDEGWKVWGTLPSSLGDARVGTVVTFIGTVSASNDDPVFGFFSRPIKGEILKTD